MFQNQQEKFHGILPQTTAGQGILCTHIDLPAIHKQNTPPTHDSEIILHFLRCLVHALVQRLGYQRPQRFPYCRHVQRLHFRRHIVLHALVPDTT